MRTLARLIFTFIMLAIAVAAGVWIWNYYEYTPWTRDARIRADVITIAPDVSGWITKINVYDNSWVNKGDIMFEIDNARYRAALDQAKAQALEAKINWQKSQSDYNRRLNLSSQSISRESLETYQLEASAAYATYQADQAAVEAAQINLDRTVYRAPYSGYVVNLNLRQGDYVSQGVTQMSLVRANSFYITGYFEETKIPSIRPGMQADIWLMSGDQHLKGHVVSIGRGISNSNNTAGNEALPSISATFTWVRLAQRIPVDIVFDNIPDTVVLSAGMTASVRIDFPHHAFRLYHDPKVTRGTSSSEATPNENLPQKGVSPSNVGNAGISRQDSLPASGTGGANSSHSSLQE